MTKKITLIELLALFSPRSDFSYRVYLSFGDASPLSKEYQLQDLIHNYFDLVKKGTGISDSIFILTVNLFSVTPDGTINILLVFDKQKASDFTCFKPSSLLNSLLDYHFKLSFYTFHCTSSGDLQLNKILQQSFEISDVERLSNLDRTCRVLNLTVEHNDDAEQRYELVIHLLDYSGNILNYIAYKNSEEDSCND